MNFGPLVFIEMQDMLLVWYCYLFIYLFVLSFGIVNEDKYATMEFGFGREEGEEEGKRGVVEFKQATIVADTHFQIYSKGNL